MEGDGEAYEAARLARIRDNKRRLAELVPAAAALAGTPPPPRQRRPRTSPDLPPRSGSARLRGEAAPEVEVDEHDAVVEPMRAGEVSPVLQSHSNCVCHLAAASGGAASGALPPSPPDES